MKKKHPSLAAASAALIAATLVVAGMALPAHADEPTGGAVPAGSATADEAVEAGPPVAAAGAAAVAPGPATPSSELAVEPVAETPVVAAPVGEPVVATPVVAVPVGEPVVAEAAPVASSSETEMAEVAGDERALDAPAASAPSLVNDDGSGAGDEDTPASLPPQTGVTLDIRVDGAEIGVNPLGERGPIERYELIVRPADGSEPITRTATTRTVFVLTGLKPGAYEIEASLHNSFGSTGVRDVWFAVPEVPGQPTITMRDGGSAALIGEIWAAPLQNPYPASVRPFRLLTTYTATLTGGGRTETREVDDVQGLGRFGFIDLEPSTTYTVTVTAHNAAGQSAPVSVQASTGAATGPTAPDPDGLNADNRGGVVVDGTPAPGTTVTASVGRDLAGATIHGWLFSEPRYLGVATVTAEGVATFALPADIPAGSHRLALTADDGTTLGWSPVEVRAADVTTPPGSGSGSGSGSAPGAGSGVGAGAEGAVSGSGAAGAANSAAGSGAVSAAAERRTLAATGGEAPRQLAIWGIAFLAAGALVIARRRVAD